MSAVAAGSIRNPRDTIYVTIHSRSSSCLVGRLQTSARIELCTTASTYPLSPAVPCRPPGAVALAHAHAHGHSPPACCSSATFHRKPPRPGSWAVVDLSAGPRPRAPLDPGSRLCDGKDPANGEMEKWIFTSPTTSLAKSVRDWGPWLSRGSGRRFRYFGPERSILTLQNPHRFGQCSADPRSMQFRALA